MSYDRAITVFSPDGRLFQVEYALEVVRRGGVALGICSKDEIVIATEKKTTAHLQDPRTIRKIVKLDEHITMTFAGLTADSRVLIDRARVECQSHRLAYEEPPSIEQIARFVAQTQQKFTQRGGRRPFGLATIIAGFDVDGTPRLFLTDPSGTYSEWKAAAIGRSYQSVTKFLETLYFNEPPKKENERNNENEQVSMISSVEELTTAQEHANPLEIGVRVLSEIVEREEKSMEIVVLRRNQPPEVVSEDAIKPIIEQWKQEKEEILKSGRSYDPIVLDSEVASS